MEPEHGCLGLGALFCLVFEAVTSPQQGPGSLLTSSTELTLGKTIC